MIRTGSQPFLQGLTWSCLVCFEDVLDFFLSPLSLPGTNIRNYLRNSQILVSLKRFFGTSISTV